MGKRASWTVEHFSQANPAGEGQGDVPALLRRVAGSIEALGEVEVQDLVLHTEVTEDGAWHSLAVYISYGSPAFRVDGKVVAGFAAFRNHLAYLPHSGEVLPGLGDRLAGYECTKGSLHFPAGEPLPDDLVRSLVDAKLDILRR